MAYRHSKSMEYLSASEQEQDVGAVTLSASATSRVPEDDEAGEQSDGSKEFTLKDNEENCSYVSQNSRSSIQHPLSLTPAVIVKPTFDGNSSVQATVANNSHEPTNLSRSESRRSSNGSEKSSLHTRPEQEGFCQHESVKTSFTKSKKSLDRSIQSDAGPAHMSTPKQHSRSPSPATDVAEGLSLDGVLPQMTSTPVGGVQGSSQYLAGGPSTSSGQKPERPQSLSVAIYPSENLDPLEFGNSDDVDTSFHSQCSAHTATHESQTDLDLYDQVQVPIVGHETMEQRSRFTVFKIRVQKAKDEGWFIFRRYSDFVRLNDTLKGVFPHFRLALPPKKWFGDNYEPTFLQERLLGLQAFLNNVVSHRDVCNSEAVREFLCIDDPPGPHDSLEESQALCEALETQIYSLRQEVVNRDTRISLLEDELALYKAKVDNLMKALRGDTCRRSLTRSAFQHGPTGAQQGVERTLNTHRRYSPSSHSQRSECSLTEQDQASEAEADQLVLQHPDKSSTSTATPSEGASNSSWDAVSEALRDNTTVLEVLKEQMAPPLFITSPPAVLSGTDPPKHAPETVPSDLQPTGVSNSDSTKPRTTAVS